MLSNHVLGVCPAQLIRGRSRRWQNFIRKGPGDKITMPMSFIHTLIDSKGEEILEGWLATHHADGLTRRDLFSDAQGRQHAKMFFLAL